MVRTTKVMTPTSRMLRLIGLTALTLLVFWVAGGFLLVMFAGVLVAVVLRGLGSGITHATRLSEGKAVMLVAATLIVRFCQRSGQVA